MAKKEIEKPDSTPPIPPKKKRGKMAMIGLVLLAATAAGGWIAYKTFLQSDYPKETLTHVDLAEPVLRFTWEQLPSVYSYLSRADRELTLMNDEIERIKGVGKSYPRQDKIATTEAKRWEKSVGKLTGQLYRFQSQVEALYVTRRVNPEKGQQAIYEKRSDLAAAMDEVLVDVQLQTAPLKEAQRLRPKGIQGILKQLKDRFL